MHIEIDGGGKVNLSAPQQTWGGGTPDVMQQARFAGQEVMAITDDTGAFDLHYLGFKTCGFKTIEEAKIAAPEFTRMVLAHMASMIAN